MSNNENKLANTMQPLHKSVWFKALVSLSVIVPLLSAHLIYPIEYWSLDTLRNATDLFKSSFAIGGICITTLTIFSLIYRSMETNEQIQISSQQYINAVQQPDRLKVREHILECHSAIISIMLIQDRMKVLGMLFDKYVEASKQEKDQRALNIKITTSEIEHIINKIEALAEDLHFNHRHIMARVPYDTTTSFDVKISNLTTLPIHLKLYPDDAVIANIYGLSKKIATDAADGLETSVRSIEKDLKEELSTLNY